MGSCYKTSDERKKKYKNLKIECYSFFIINENPLKLINLKSHPQSLSTKENNFIYNQMEKCVCKIVCQKGFGTGFFCNIPIPNTYLYLPVLITNNHVLGEKDISSDKYIKISINDELDKHELYMSDRLAYTSKKYDVTIIELKKEDNLKIYGYEIDYYAYNQPHNYFEQLAVYMVHYPLSIKVSKSIGSIRVIESNYNIKHTCSTKSGSSGGPIINLNTFKLIGVHKGSSLNQEFNFGTFIKGPIEELFGSYNNIFNKPIYSSFLKNIDFKMIKETENEIKLNYDRYINFTSLDQKINLSILCSGNSIFANIENILYNICPKYKNSNCYFLCNGIQLNRFKTINENQIREEGYVIMVIHED